MGAQHLGLQEENVTVSEVWSKQLTCYYNRCITPIAVVKYLGYKGPHLQESEAGVLYVRGFGSRSPLPSLRQIYYLLLFLQHTMHRNRGFWQCD